jgi:hypothetical protein
MRGSCVTIFSEKDGQEIILAFFFILMYNIFNFLARFLILLLPLNSPLNRSMT